MKKTFFFCILVILCTGCNSEIDRKDPKKVIEAFANAFVSGDTKTAVTYLGEEYFLENNLDRVDMENELEEYTENRFITIKILSFSKSSKSAVAKLQFSNGEHIDSSSYYELAANDEGNYEIVAIK